MKRLCLWAAILLLLGLCACTGQGTPAPVPTASPAPATPEPTEAPSTPAPDPEPAPTATGAPEPTASPAPEPTPEAEETLTVGGREYPARRFSGDLTGGGGLAFACILPTEAVAASFEHNAWIFRCAETPEAFLELSFIAGGDVESLLPGFMDGYLEFTEIEFSESARLGRVRGDVGRVSAAGEDLWGEGWLLGLSGGTVSAALVCPLSHADEGALLRAVLDTFTLN